MLYLQRIRDLREDHDEKQETLARYLHITKPQYYLYESGKREIPVRLLMMIADYYRVSLDYLTERTDRKEVNR